MTKPKLWLLLAGAADPHIPLVLPTVAWMARDAGAEFEWYGEAPRDGSLFAGTGSTVLGGAHHQQFNYLNAVFDVSYLIFGSSTLFRSSIDVFGATVLAEASAPAELYRLLLDTGDVTPPSGALFAPTAPLSHVGESIDIRPYVYPEIFFRRALGLAAPPDDWTVELLDRLRVEHISQLLLDGAAADALGERFGNVATIDSLRPGDGYGSLTLRIAERWKQRAAGVAFGDPLAILAQIPSHCRHARVAVYAPKQPLAAADVAVSAYTEETSAIAEQTARLAVETGNRVLSGRQTGDGDLFAWSKSGVCLQIIDPNRPAFPIVDSVEHRWAGHGADLYADEPDDATLLRYAAEGKLLATIVWHSGEVAHNEAMLNLFELAGFCGVKMGVGVHAARYESCPQLWELLQVPRERGGVRGLIEPLLHSGGMGVLAEINCPPELLRGHCDTALRRIRALAGAGATPRGYYAFMDAGMDTLQPGDAELHRAIGRSGLEYVVSSARPGRNRIIRDVDGCVVLNQTCRSIASASPFVRITTVEDILESAPVIRPGWMIGALDAPVIAFNPYIWRHGSRFMQIVDWLLETPNVVNVLPHTIARYARLLAAQGMLPGSTDTPDTPDTPVTPAQAGA